MALHIFCLYQKTLNLSNNKNLVMIRNLSRSNIISMMLSLHIEFLNYSEGCLLQYILIYENTKNRHCNIFYGMKNVGCIMYKSFISYNLDYDCHKIVTRRACIWQIINVIWLFYENVVKRSTVITYNLVIWFAKLIIVRSENLNIFISFMAQGQFEDFFYYATVVNNVN